VTRPGAEAAPTASDVRPGDPDRPDRPGSDPPPGTGRRTLDVTQAPAWSDLRGMKWPEVIPSRAKRAALEPEESEQRRAFPQAAVQLAPAAVEARWKAINLDCF
jgi:hypothetical protein